MRYAIWNNKGGVGKTYFSFMLGAEVALANPDKNIILADMCPQANLSEVALGGNGQGSSRLTKFLSENNRVTIGGYFDRRIRSPHEPTKNEATYLVRARDHNSNAPGNLYILLGDPSLEIQSQVMSQICAQQLPEDSWAKVHLWLHDLIDGCESHLGSESCVTFIDCNPSFSVYTELAMLAASRLIVPCTSDSSSARAIDNLAALVYGYRSSYSNVGFSQSCKKFNLKPPLIQAVVLNRTTQYSKSASKAFGAMFEEIRERVMTFGKAQPESFVDRRVTFREIPDNHTSTVASSYFGKPMSQLTAGSYEIRGKKVQLNAPQLERYRTAFTELRQSLGL